MTCSTQGADGVARAHADEFAVRVNRAVELLVDVSPADAVRGLQVEFGLSEHQARRYVNAAAARPDGVVVPERTVVFTVRRAFADRWLARAGAGEGSR